MRRSLYAVVTVANLTAQGLDAVEASCLRCGEAWSPPIAFLPPATTLEKVEALMACPACGGRDVEIRAPGKFECLIH